MNVSLDGDRLSVHAGGRNRLCGGIPIFEEGASITAPASLSGALAKFPAEGHDVTVGMAVASDADIVTFTLSPGGAHSHSGDHFLGLFFDTITDLCTGVTLWRYAPWKCWTKPLRVTSLREMEEDDIQFFYWQHADGVYGAAIPLCGKGYRSTLGRVGNLFGAKARACADGVNMQEIPLMSVGWGSDPYQLFHELYAEGLRQMGLEENLREQKKFPPAFDYLGACTWNASDTGKLLREDFLMEMAGSLAEKHVPVRWLLIDDGWMDSDNGRLNALAPASSRFRRGFNPMVREMRERFGIQDVGIWYAANGHWNGINPDSPLGREYRSDLYTWQQRERQDMPASAMQTNRFLSPSSSGLHRFYTAWNRFFREEGITFIKVDNQSVTERMTAGRIPLDDLARALHNEINNAALGSFAGALINCMAMSAEAFYHFGRTAVARTSEDYFEYHPEEGYNLQRGNAAAHVLQGVYNSLYFSQMVYTDLDMFQTHNPNAVFHALARALSGGPVYISDRVGEEQPEVLRPLHYADGLLIRTDEPLLPTRDCLFQIQDPALFKAFSRSGGKGLLALFNCADADSVDGTVSPADVGGLEGEEFAVYDHFGKTLRIMRRDESIPVQLGRLGYGLYEIAPLRHGAALLGLIDKYNAPGTVLNEVVAADTIRGEVREGGAFAAAVKKRPRAVRIDGKEVSYVLFGALLTMEVPGAGVVAPHAVEIEL